MPEEFPAATMRRIFRVDSLEESEDYKAIKNHLYQFRRHGESARWDEYRMKISSELLEIWATVLVDCRRNGFIAPHVEKGVIVFDQVMGSGADKTDLCTMCDRECKRRDDVDTGEGKRRKLLNRNYEEPKPCWGLNS
jgi:hypothetical protein